MTNVPRWPLLLLYAIVVMSIGPAGAAPADPWIGQWKSVDLDGSNQKLTITRRADGAYDVILYDDSATLCGGIAADGKGVGAVSGNTMTGTVVITCADGRVAGTFPFKGTYDPKTDTFTDGLGVVWSRIPAPPPVRSTGALPLGSLVLQAREAPGLKRKTARPAMAKKVLTGTIRPARLPGFRAKKTQVAHFAKGKIDLWSLAFVMKNTTAARLAAKAIAKAGDGSRIRLANAAYTLGRRIAVVLWQRGRVVSAIVFAASRAAPARRRVSRSYAALADARVARAVSATTWQRALSATGPKGKISRSAALRLFAIAYGPLPGVNRPSGPSGRVLDGTLAANALLAYWRTLTPAQRAEAQRLLGLAGVSISNRKPARAPRSTRPLRAMALGDPNFTPDAKFQKIADFFKSAYEARLGRPLKLTLVVGTSSSADWADELAVDGEGRKTDFPTTCRVRVGPKVQAVSASVAPLMIGHEVFHCFQDDILTPSVLTQLLTTGRAWVVEGMPNWAAESVFPVSWPIARDYISLGAYFKGCRSYLFGLAYSASGFFGHFDDSVGSFWTRVVDVLQAPDSLTAFDRAGGNVPQFLQTWASSVYAQPLYGLAWTSFNPATPATGAGCEPSPIVDDAAVESGPVSVSPYTIDAAPADRPLLNISIARGHARLSDSALETTELGDSWFWVGEPGVKPDCPEGGEGTPPPAPELRLPAALALTGGAAVGRGQVHFASLKEFCKEKQPPIVPIPPDKGGSGGKVGKSCGKYCGHDFGDPHLITFDGVAYDFMAAGEFTLVRSRSRGLEIQVRQQPYPGSKWVSITTGAAMRVGGARIVIFQGSPLQVRVNGRPVLVTAKGMKFPGGGSMRYLPPEFRGLPRKLEVTWPDGTFAQIWMVGDSGLALLVNPAARRAEALAGLLGNADGRKANDFATRGGRRLASKVITHASRGRAYRVLYRQYGDSWRVTRRSSLFDYAPGQSPRRSPTAGSPLRCRACRSPPATRDSLRAPSGSAGACASRIRPWRRAASSTCS